MLDDKPDMVKILLLPKPGILKNVTPKYRSRDFHKFIRSYGEPLSVGANC